MKQEWMRIVSQEQLAPKIFKLTLMGDLVSKMNTPGQFIHIKIPREDLLLRRPISLNQMNQTMKQCTIIYRVEGVGTSYLSQMNVGEKLDVMGPLGNGFDVNQVNRGQVVFIVGGGIGIPPMYELAKQLKNKGVNVIHFLGYASKEVAYFQEEFMTLGQTFFATDDGSLGVKGTVGDLLVTELSKQKPDVVYACGATGMLKTVKTIFEPITPNVFLSMEQRMACGMGACYACVCHVPNKNTSVKVCDEGPVFNASEVIL